MIVWKVMLTCSSMVQVQVVAGDAFSYSACLRNCAPPSAAALPAGVQLVREGNQAGEKEEEDIHGGIQNGQLFPPLPAVPLPECSAGCARAQPLEVSKRKICSLQQSAAEQDGGHVFSAAECAEITRQTLLLCALSPCLSQDVVIRQPLQMPTSTCLWCLAECTHRGAAGMGAGVSWHWLWIQHSEGFLDTWQA